MSMLRAAGFACLGALIAASPAAATVTVQVGGRFIQGSEALRQAVGLDALNPRFTAGLLLDFGGTPIGWQEAIETRRSTGQGVTTEWWTVASNQRTLTQSSYALVYDHDRSDAGDPSYPLWVEQAGDKMLILFDWGVIPDRLAFDFDALFQQERTIRYRALGRVDRYPNPLPIWSEELIVTPPSSNRMQNGGISCTSSEGRETLVRESAVAFRERTYAATVTARCGVSIDVKAFLPVAPPTVDPVAPAVPEPATWGLMIAGFALVGGAARRSRPALSA